jgi:hypothetical protein
VAKIEQEVKELKTAVAGLNDKIDKLQFYLVQIMNKINEGVPLSEGGATPVSSTPGAVSVDITPLEDRLEQLSREIVSKADLAPLQEELAKISNERLKEAEETVDNVTVLLEKGLALTELAASLKEIEAHLQELVTPPKD